MSIEASIIHQILKELPLARAEYDLKQLPELRSYIKLLEKQLEQELKIRCGPAEGQLPPKV